MASNFFRDYMTLFQVLSLASSGTTEKCFIFTGLTLSSLSALVQFTRVLHIVSGS